jgi:hypothetical protein
MPEAPSAELARILEPARRLGVEFDEEEALPWLTAMAAGSAGGDLVVDTRAGVFGHRVTTLGFSPEELAYFRRVGQLVEFHDEPGVVETALALSGSAAQSKIQSYPGDCDFFQRVNIRAVTRPGCCAILARLIRDKALQTERGAAHQLIEVKFGSFPTDVVRSGRTLKAGSPISWAPTEIRAGRMVLASSDGAPVTITWNQAANDPGWTKLDWVIADPLRGQLANASNILDVTWESPDGTITPLDGYLDPYFQRVHLEAESIPIFSKLAKHVSAHALDNYVAQLEKEVNKHLNKDLNYGKATKRMYNIFLLTGRHEEAAFIRELFDEPATVLYQVGSLIRTINDAFAPGSSIPLDALYRQAEVLIAEVNDGLEGTQETEIVHRLEHLRDSLSDHSGRPEWTAQAEAARPEVINIVNSFFRATSPATRQSACPLTACSMLEAPWED